MEAAGKENTTLHQALGQGVFQEHMTTEESDVPAQSNGLAKCPTGIDGLDDVTSGGLPLGRPTLVCGGAGCGKTLLAMEFIVKGATVYGEPGVFIAFEEKADELVQNFSSLGFELDRLVQDGKIALDHIRIDRGEFEESGAYDLEGLFIRIGHAIDKVGAKRLVLDTPETLFGGLSNTAILRSELKRLFEWTKEKGVTTIVTGERGSGVLTRQGLEEYVSDCVILLDHRVQGQVSTRRLRVIKYRGSAHGTNEYPFLIDRNGISVLPITALGLQHRASSDRVSSGVPRLDTMLGGKGFFRGSSILVTGTAGTGKTTLAGHFVDAACRRGEKCIYFAFEESRDQIIRNHRSVGLDLQQWIDQGLLELIAARPTVYGLEMHLAIMYKQIDAFKPQNVVVDPISNFVSVGPNEDVMAMMVRLVDYLKNNLVTAFFTHLNSAGASLESTDIGISSIIDTWILLRDVETNGERNRGLYILKSRGMSHSREIREFLLTDHGIQVLDVYRSPQGVLIGSARVASQQQNARDADERRVSADRKRQSIEAQINALQSELAGIRGERDFTYSGDGLSKDHVRPSDTGSNQE
jgi:circadian clock protein KaiC